MNSCLFILHFIHRFICLFRILAIVTTFCITALYQVDICNVSLEELKNNSLYTHRTDSNTRYIEKLNNSLTIRS